MFELLAFGVRSSLVHLCIHPLHRGGFSPPVFFLVCWHPSAFAAQGPGCSVPGVIVSSQRFRAGLPVVWHPGHRAAPEEPAPGAFLSAVRALPALGLWGHRCAPATHGVGISASLACPARPQCHRGRADSAGITRRDTPTLLFPIQRNVENCLR